MTVGGRRRLGRRGTREKESFAREHQDEIELELPARGLSGFGLAVMRQTRPRQPPVVLTSASFPFVLLSVMRCRGRERQDTNASCVPSPESETRPATPGIAAEVVRLLARTLNAFICSNT